MLNVLKKFETGIIIVLLVLMMITLTLATIELAVIMYQEITKPPKFLLDLAELLTIFGFFLMVLIGLELLETIKAYIEGDKFHLEVVIIVAMIAVARKIIVLDYKNFEPQTFYGMSAMLVGLAVGYYLVKKARGEKEQSEKAMSNPHHSSIKE